MAIIAAAAPAYATIDMSPPGDIAKIAALAAAHGGPTHDFLLWQHLTFNGRNSVPPETTICLTSYLHTDGKTQAAVAAPQIIISLFSLLGSNPIATTTPRTSVLSVTGDLARRVKVAMAEAAPYQATTLLASCDLATHTRMALFVVTNPALAPVTLGYECMAPGTKPLGVTTTAGNWLWRFLQTQPSACSGIPFGNFASLPLAGQ